MSKNGGIIGVSDHGGWAVLVTVARDGTLLDRRRVELVDEGLPKIPHHSEGQGLPIEEAVALVERVRAFGGEARGDCLGTAVFDGGAAYPRYRPSQMSTASTHDCRANQGLPCAEQC